MLDCARRQSTVVSCQASLSFVHTLIYQSPRQVFRGHSVFLENEPRIVSMLTRVTKSLAIVTTIWWPLTASASCEMLLPLGLSGYNCNSYRSDWSISLPPRNSRSLLSLLSHFYFIYDAIIFFRLLYRPLLLRRTYATQYACSERSNGRQGRVDTLQSARLCF